MLSGFSLSREMQKSNSATSLDSTESIAEVISLRDSAPAAVGDFHDSAIDGGDEEYGEVRMLQIEGRPRSLYLS